MLLFGVLTIGVFIFQFTYYSQTKITVAIIDTGIDLKQIKFKLAAIRGFNIHNPDKPPQDDNGHGTQVASIIYFLEPRINLMPIKAIPKSGMAMKQELAQGIVAAVDRGAKIINISAGVISSSADLEQAVRYAEEKGVVIVAAAGGNGTGIEYPAAYPTVLAVGGVNRNNERLYNSNIGSELDVVALGEYATIGLRGECYAGAGTSLATPIVSVYAARILLNNLELKPQEVRDMLLNSVVDIGDHGKDDLTGYGLVRHEKIISNVCNKNP
jgi:subtilisin family serine protease